MKRAKETQVVQLADFIDVKGWKSLGNKLHDGKLIAVKELQEPFVPMVKEQVKRSRKTTPKASSDGSAKDNGKLRPGDTIELF